MEELLKEFLKIDSKAQKIIEKVENKDEKIDEIIEEQLNEAKEKIDNEFRGILELRKQILQNRYNEMVVQISSEEKEKLKELDKNYEEKKYMLEEKILRNILDRKAK